MNVEEEVAQHDKVKREEETRKVLERTKKLTNGSAGDPEITGQVLLWLVEEAISVGHIIRTLADTMPNIQFKDQCLLQHKGMSGRMNLFGYNT